MSCTAAAPARGPCGSVRHVLETCRVGILYNHDNEFLHYQDDWYILAEKEDAYFLVYYRGTRLGLNPTSPEERPMSPECVPMSSNDSPIAIHPLVGARRGAPRHQR